MLIKSRAVLALCTAFLAGTGPAAGQTPTIQLVPAEFPRIELAGNVGWEGVRKPSFDNWNRRYDTGTAGVTAGLFWTRHLKSEVTFARSGEGSMYSTEQIGISGRVPLFRYLEHRFQTVTVAPALSFQFLENRWVHPFVTGGAQIVRERHDISERERRIETSTSRTFVDPFVGGGLKFFVSERAFVRTDLQYAFRGSHDNDRTTWTVGAGVEF